jgi:hypothetical protein
MNVGSLNQNLYNQITKPLKNKKAEAAITFDNTERRMEHTSLQKDDLMNQFWGMTNDMPKENQVSLAASVIVSKVFNNGITNENKGFVKSISDRFSPEEIGALKQEVKNHPMIQNKDSAQIQNFMKQFDKFLNNGTSELEGLQKQRANPNLRTPEEIFFQTTLNFNSTPLIGQAKAA